MTSFNKGRRPEQLYPKGKSYNNEELLDYGSILSHQPMPWDTSGQRFSKAINDSSFKNYVQKNIKSEVVEVSIRETFVHRHIFCLVFLTVYLISP